MQGEIHEKNLTNQPTSLQSSFFARGYRFATLCLEHKLIP